jgi:hypothetical protein
MPFVYSTDALSNLRETISRARLFPYMKAAQADLSMAIQLYEYNSLLSAGLYGVLQALEIAFRNSSLNKTLTAEIAPDWCDRSPLRAGEIKSVKEAKDKIIRRNEAITPGRVVAELNFGFWTFLVSSEYEKILWVPHLHKAFPYLYKPDRDSVFLRFKSIKGLRNAIAHHEPILNRNLSRDYSDIIEALGWLCPTSATWVQSHNRFTRYHGK